MVWRPEPGVPCTKTLKSRNLLLAGSSMAFVNFRSPDLLDGRYLGSRLITSK